MGLVGCKTRTFSLASNGEKRDPCLVFSQPLGDRRGGLQEHSDPLKKLSAVFKLG